MEIDFAKKKKSFPKQNKIQILGQFKQNNNENIQDIKIYIGSFLPLRLRLVLDKPQNSTNFNKL